MHEIGSDSLHTTITAARVVHKSAATIRYWRLIGILPSVKTVGGVHFFRHADVIHANAEIEGRKRHGRVAVA